MISPFSLGRIGITGGAGVLGTCLARKLQLQGCRKIVLFDRTQPIFSEDGVECFRGDILRDADLEQGLRGCAVVFHLAGLADPERAHADPEQCMSINVMGTANVMGACHRLGVQKTVYASTAHVYGVPVSLPIHEQHRKQPRSIYATSKLAGEIVASGYARTFGGAVTIARLSNLYGGFVGPKTVIGRALEYILSGRPIQLRSMAEVRDFLYIEDAAEAMIRLASADSTDEGIHIVNVSSGTGICIEEAMQELAGAAEQQGLARPEIAPPSGEADREVPVFVLDNSCLRELTGWTPETSMRQGLSETLKARLGRA